MINSRKFITRKSNMSAPKKPLKIGVYSRAQFVLLVIGLLFLSLLGRALYVQLFDHAFLQSQGDARFRRVLTLEATRGEITDRNAEPLAISAQVASIWASPSGMEQPSPGKLNQLANLLEIPLQDIQNRLAEKKRSFVYLKRQINPDIAKQILALNIPGIASQPEYRRFYPSGESFSHVIGFTGIDGSGQEGLELARNRMLAGKNGSRIVLKDRQGHIVDDLAAIDPPHDGQNLVLSMDQRLQYLAYRELKHAVDINKAKAGSAVVLNAQTGEILALVNVPSYNPNSRSHISPDARRNRAVIDIFEPGSTMKPMAVSKALDTGKVTPDTIINTDSYMLGPATVKDPEHSGNLTVTGVIQKSSNVGASKMSLMFTPEDMWTFYHEAGFGRPVRVGFPGESSGILRNWKHWRPIEQATMAFGYGISVSLLQLARAYTMFTTDGKLLPLSFTKLNMPMPGKQMISAKTAKEMRDMLVTVTEPGGTALRAQVLGYRVAGKTGTARKLEHGIYQPNKHVGLFVGFAPASKPKLIVAVMIDEPRAGSYYGGRVAAPAFSKIMGASLRMLGIPPDVTKKNTLTPIKQIQDVREDT